MVYGRSYKGEELRFEPSGGLLHASLILQDKETDTYWSIMEGEALAGELRGTSLVELASGVKARWSDWRALHPDTLVLSVDGVEHQETSPYDNYFRSDRGFRGAEASDPRMTTKAPVYAFRLADRAYAVPFEAIAGGATFAVGARAVFLFRDPEAALFESTAGFLADGPFTHRDGRWRPPGGAVFDREAGTFLGGEGSAPVRLEGFDTFWFNWSMTHPDTAVLGATD